MSKSQRVKGRKGQCEAAKLLADRDWRVIQTTAGIATEDIIAIDIAGVTWSVEVKNCVSITDKHRHQAMEQAKKNKLPWMLMSKISGTSSWLIQRKGFTPSVWHEKKELL